MHIYEEGRREWESERVKSESVCESDRREKRDERRGKKEESTEREAS